MDRVERFERVELCLKTSRIPRVQIVPRARKSSVNNLKFEIIDQVLPIASPVRRTVIAATIVEEKFPKENVRVNREMRDEILVYESILYRFWAKMGSKCKENSVKNWILGFRF